MIGLEPAREPQPSRCTGHWLGLIIGRRREVVEQAVVVQVEAEPRRQAPVDDRRQARRARRSGAVVQEHVRRAVAVHDDQVEERVVVDVGELDRRRVDRPGVEERDAGRDEDALAVVQVEDAAAGVRDDEVGVAVVVDVAGRDRRSASDAVAGSGMLAPKPLRVTWSKKKEPLIAGSLAPHGCRT